MIDLPELGWDERWARLFAAHAGAGLVPARVAIEFNHIYRVITAAGELQAQLAGRILHRATGRHELAAVGDWVAVRKTGQERTGTIEEILPRRSKFSRKVAGELTEEQVVAANIDTVFLVMGLDRDYNPRRLERYLLTSFESGASPVVLLSKADLVTDAAERVVEVASLAPGVPVHAISAVSHRHADGTVSPPDVSIVEQYLGLGRTGALLGSSGAGKSTLINTLSGTAALKTAEVRASDSRGRHTTRHRQLIILPGRGLLIDTPGMRELQLWDVADAARDTFDDIATLAAGCRFTDCRHQDEPRCAVKAAVEVGTLPEDRLASYLKLQDEMRVMEGRRDVRAQIEEKRRSKAGSRAMKQLYKDKER
jgi:ribosome biogenesis GTPase